MNNKILLLIASTFTLFFGLMLITELNVYFYAPPKFDELILSEGKLQLMPARGRYARPISLVTNTKRIVFKSYLHDHSSSRYKTFIIKNNFLNLQNKDAKVWWREEKYLGVKVNRLYQLVVEDKPLIRFEEKKMEYENDKSYLSFFGYLTFVLFGIFCFCCFAIDSIKAQYLENKND